MRYLLIAGLVLLPTQAHTQALQPGAWDVTSTVVELSVPGLPGFIQRMVRGKARAEHKRLLDGQGIEALLAPDPKAQCRVDSQKVDAGHYTQALSCPQKHGEPMHITRVGTYDANGFTGRASVAGVTPKGALSITLDQRAARVRG